MDAIGHINVAERFLCGGLLRRMVRVGWRFDRHLPKYGVDGTLMLLRARALQCWMLIFGAPMVLFAAAGLGVVATFLFVLVVAVGIVAIVHTWTSADLGRQWRSKC